MIMNVMTEQKSARESNIEVLRILAICGVIILHYNLGGGFEYTGDNTISRYILEYLECCVVCSVDLFMMISGYFMVGSKKRKPWKIIELVAQVIIFNGILYLASSIRGGVFSLETFVTSLLPAKYFVILYVITYIISPYVSLVFEALDRDGVKKFVFTLFIIFSVYCTIVDILELTTGQLFNGLNSLGREGDQSGYNIVNFILCWIIGAYIRKTDFTLPKLRSFLIYQGLAILILLYYRIMISNGATLVQALSYCNPLVIMEAVAIFVLFREWKIGSIRVLNTLAKGAFTVYLLHGRLLGHLGIDKAVCQNPLLMVGHIAASIIGVYLVCWVVYCAYDFVMHFVWNQIENKVHLPEIGITR